MTNSQNQISKRKEEYINLCLNHEVAYQKSNGFEQYDFIHDTLIEVVSEDINFDTQFLGKTISYPFIISSMTEGTIKAKVLNENIAITANEFSIPISADVIDVSGSGGTS